MEPVAEASPPQHSPIDQPELGRLLGRAADGDEAAWREIVRLFGRRVYALAKSRCKSAEMAEEITQSVFATVAAKLPSGQYAEQGRFESWLFRVAMNRLRDEIRRARRQASPVDPEGLLAHPAATQTDSPRTDLLSRLREAMLRLPDADREIVELRHQGGLSFKQLADLLNEPLGTLLARHHRALKKLHSLLSDGGDELEAAS
jgi:RNA polymerase sigma-70 factor (ECF subfamily)